MRMAVLASVTILTLCACSSHSDNAPMSSFAPQEGYRFSNGRSSFDSDFIAVTMSGGGVRASALAYGTLIALRKFERGGVPLPDKIDLISSVSGGSVVAAWVGLHGVNAPSDPALHQRLMEFLTRDNMSTLKWRGLNPAAVGGYLVSSRKRVDILDDLFADLLYGNATYAEIEREYRSHANQPYIILNAADVALGVPFPFTQGQFDLLCSDLSRFRLSTAVAASAAFPVFLSAVSLKNFAGCDVHQSELWMKEGAPAWVDALLARYQQELPAPRQYESVRRARAYRSYFESNHDRFVHLLDGGLSDNLGIRSVLTIEDDPAREPGLRQSLADTTSKYTNVTDLLFVVVNARSEKQGTLGESEYPPGLFSTLRRVIDHPLDNATLGTQAYLASELTAATGREPRVIQGAERLSTPGLSVDASGTIRIRDSGAVRRAYIATVDFDLIPDDQCRRWYKELPTSWTLTEGEIRLLIALPEVLLRASPALANFTGTANGGPDWAQVCSPQKRETAGKK